MCLETKFYIFWNFFTIFKRFLKTRTVYEQCLNSKITVETLFIPKTDFEKSFKNSKKIPKNVKFSLQAHFHMKNTLSTWNRQFEFWKRKNERGVKRVFTPQLTIVHLSLSLYIYMSKTRVCCAHQRVWWAHLQNLMDWLQARRIQTVETDLLYEWCVYMQNFDIFEFI